MILISVRKGSPHADRLEDGGRVLADEGHDMPRSPDVADPKSVDQPEYTVYGHLSDNAASGMMPIDAHDAEP